MRGATLGCRVDRCADSFHLACAGRAGCTFYPAKFLLACKHHASAFASEPGAERCGWFECCSNRSQSNVAARGRGSTLKETEGFYWRTMAGRQPVAFNRHSVWRLYGKLWSADVCSYAGMQSCADVCRRADPMSPSTPWRRSMRGSGSARHGGGGRSSLAGCKRSRDDVQAQATQAVVAKLFGRRVRQAARWAGVSNLSSRR